MHVPPITLISVFSQLPLLQNLRISGVPSTAIPLIMACLPNLIELDTDYLQDGNYPLPSMPLPRLQKLTIRPNSATTSVSDVCNWACSLIPHEGPLQSFTLSFTITIPLSFVTHLICRHGRSLTEFCVGFAQVTPEVLTYLCRNCPALELLKCSVPNSDMVRQVLSIPSAITKRLLANNRKSYRTRQEPSDTPVCLVGPS